MVRTGCTDKKCCKAELIAAAVPPLVFPLYNGQVSKSVVIIFILIKCGQIWNRFRMLKIICHNKLWSNKGQTINGQTFIEGQTLEVQTIEGPTLIKF